MNISTAEKLMNNLGKKQIPFLFIVDFNMVDINIIPLSELHKHNIQYSVNEQNSKINKMPDNIVFKTYPITFSEYKKMFDKIKTEISNGNSYLLNLTAETPINTNLSLSDIYKLSNAKYKLLFLDKFVVFSPETFVKTHKGKIHSYPMKGTIDANIPNAKKVILADKKEAAEHATITDLIRNDLSIVSENVKVEKYRYIDKINTLNSSILQVSSEISGCLPDNYNEQIGSILFKLLPAGSISGAPKQKTIDIINNTENYKRNFYTGIFGVFNGYDIDTGVMIRFIEKTKNKMVFKSGGGITINSNAENEYNEMIKKVYLPFY